MANTSLRVSELDFFSIRENLKTYLRDQPTFTDYDFEGSGLSVLLDILAYNTYYNSFYLNMAASESFLDTAQVRQNILSHAKAINYVPSSSVGSLSRASIIVTPSDPSEDTTVNYIVIDKYTKLIGQDKNGISYPFVTLNANSASKNLITQSFNFSNVYLKQGEVMTHQYIVDTTNNPEGRFQIPSANVDTTTIVVKVQESRVNTYSQEYTLAEDLTVLGSNSTVYFVEEDQDLNYTIYFGDGVIGKKPATNNIVIVTYLDVVGTQANNVTNFSFVDKVAGLYRSNVIFTNVVSSYGGTNKEDIDTIRYRAPQYYTTQNRCVTINDYESLIVKDYNNIDAVSVWGGEENDPVVYGKVYMSLKTKGYYQLTELDKQTIKNDLILKRNVLTIIPEIVDPDYCYILARGYVSYNPSMTSKTSEDFLNSVRTNVLSYNTKELNTFKSTFRKSKLQYYIEQSDDSITGSDIYYYLQKQVDIEPGVARNYEVSYNAGIRKGDNYRKLYTYPTVSVVDTDGFTKNVFFEEIPESFTGISEILMENAGIGYSSLPTVTINGDGTGATGYPVVVNGKIKSIKILSSGSNYTRASVSITGGGGSEARAIAKVQSNYGTIRSYYYKSNGEKIIVNNQAGTIDYAKGKIVLTGLLATAVTRNAYYPDNVLTVNVIPNGDIITPLRNRILVIDPNDTQSIQIELRPES